MKQKTNFRAKQIRFQSFPRTLVTLLIIGLIFSMTNIISFAEDPGGDLLESAGHQYKRVTVPAVWYPIDVDTYEVQSWLNPKYTYPDMYSRFEVADLKEDDYFITYMGTPEPASNTWTANNFMYTSNLWFTDRFHRIIRQGYGTYDLGGVSPVFRLQYGSFEDSDYVSGLHGSAIMPYLNGESLHLYIATRPATLSDPVFVEDDLTVISEFSDVETRSALIGNVIEVVYPDLDNWGSLAYFDLDGIDTMYLYQYTSDDLSSGYFLSDGSGYTNFMSASFADLPAGKYEVVFPVYWQRNIWEFMSSPEVFSRNRYTVDDTFHFTMTRVLTRSIEARKEWVGPSLDKATLVLLADGEPLDSRTVNSENDWTAIFNHLPQYNVSTGEEIDYAIKEEAPDGYDAMVTGNMVEGFVIQNINAETVSVEVKKEWVGPAAEEATFVLLVDGQEVARGVTDAANDWKYAFTGLPKYDSTSGSEIIYKLAEVAFTGYESEVSGDARQGFLVTNTNVETRSVAVEIIWDVPPATMLPVKTSVQLLADGSEAGSATDIDSSDDWKHLWSGLTKYDLSTWQAIKYSIQAEMIEGFETSISGDADAGFVVTYSTKSESTEAPTEESKPEPTEAPTEESKPEPTHTPTEESKPEPTEAKPTETKPVSTEKQSSDDLPKTGESASAIPVIVGWLLLAGAALLLLNRKKRPQ